MSTFDVVSINAPFDHSEMGHIDINPELYGSKGQSWHPNFINYMERIVSHLNYRGMPDARKPDGKIQWEAPSNRSGGAYQDTHHKRRDWWHTVAESRNINTFADQWISRTAKLIHPFGAKPCKRCGKILRLAYVYPNYRLRQRLEKQFGTDLFRQGFEEIGTIVRYIIEKYGAIAIPKLQSALSTRDIKVPDLGVSVDKWMEWLEQSYIPKEPKSLSPGAMSNAPDRFDGFHSFNICCRGKADTGRHPPNMLTYMTDRRVFEFWTEGDWIAADRLMGEIKSKLRDQACQDGGEGPVSADHIGPLSLGFCHRPEFLLLSNAANSAKNNRMRLWDVRYLLEAEAKGEKIVTWHTKPLWDLRKWDVVDDEKALRLSKLLRDNQRNAMTILSRMMEMGHYDFLMSLLELEHADYDPTFINLRCENFITTYDELRRTYRLTKYSNEQKARRIRVAFKALVGYSAKANRHTFLFLDNPQVSQAISRADDILRKLPNTYTATNSVISLMLDESETKNSDAPLRELVSNLPKTWPVEYLSAKQELTTAMAAIAGELSNLWTASRYVRSKFNFD